MEAVVSELVRPPETPFRRMELERAEDEVRDLQQSIERFGDLVTDPLEKVMTVMDQFVSIETEDDWGAFRDEMLGFAPVTRELLTLITDQVSSIKQHHDQLDHFSLGLIPEDYLLSDSLQRVRRQLEDSRLILSMLSHDIRSPLGPLVSIMEILADADWEEVARYQRVLVQSKERLGAVLRMVANIVDFQRCESGSLVARNVESNDLCRSVFADALTLTSHLVEQKSIRLVGTFPPELSFCTDMGLLQSVVTNLINNAVKFSYPGSKVEVRCVVGAEGQLIISVRDWGVGMDNQQLETLFHLKKNASTLGTEKERGFGLGMPMVSRLVKVLGGKISVESTVGEGTEFVVVIPCQDTGSEVMVA